VYVRDIETTVYRLDKELRGFAKVHLGPGQSTDVEIALDERSFAFYDVDQSRWRIEGGEFDAVVARSSVGNDPDRVFLKLGQRMIREAPLRFLVAMSGGSGSIKAFDGFTKLLSTLGITGRRS
jgi:hypothetical protein